jgi:hypothetical protein
MKIKMAIYIVVLLVLFISGCNLQSIDSATMTEHETDKNEGEVVMPLMYAKYLELPNSSVHNGIHTTLYICAIKDNFRTNKLSCPVAADEVLVGGGAEARALFPIGIRDSEYQDDYYDWLSIWMSGLGSIHYPNGRGHFIVSSYPNDQLTEWIAESKEHGHQSRRMLVVFALGMKVEGLTKEQLKSYIKLTKTTSAMASTAPLSSVTLPSTNDVLLSGGAQLNTTASGIFLNGSYPEGNRWIAKGKNLLSTTSSRITSYMISIHKHIPINGVVKQINSSVSQSSISTDPNSWGMNSRIVNHGVLNTGVGAKSESRSSVRYLKQLDLRFGSVADADYNPHQGGTLTYYKIGVRVTDVDGPVVPLPPLATPVPATFKVLTYNCSNLEGYSRHACLSNTPNFALNWKAVASATYYEWRVNPTSPIYRTTSTHAVTRSVPYQGQVRACDGMRCSNWVGFTYQQ